MSNSFVVKDSFAKYAHVPSKLIYGEVPINAPFVSIVIPAYNHPVFFKQTLLSCINQRCEFSYEIIIVDNNHPKFQQLNQEIVATHMVDNIRYYVNEDNIGGVGNENRGIELSVGRYITFCHDDDMLRPDTLHNLVSCVKNVNSESAIFGQVEPIDAESKNIHMKSSGLMKCIKRPVVRLTVNDFFLSNLSNGCGTLYNKDCLIKIGGFDEEMIPCPDYALNTIYTFLYGAYQIKETTFNYRCSSENDTLSCFANIPPTNKKIRMMAANLTGTLSIFRKCRINLMEKIETASLAALYNKELSSFSKFKGRVIIKLMNMLKLSRVFFNGLFKSVR